MASLRGANVAPVNSCRGLGNLPLLHSVLGSPCPVVLALAAQTNCARLAALDALHKLCGSTQTKNLSRRDRICVPTHSCPQNLCPWVCVRAVSTRVFQIPHPQSILLGTSLATPNPSTPAVCHEDGGGQVPNMGTLIKKISSTLNGSNWDQLIRLLLVLARHGLDLAERERGWDSLRLWDLT